MSEKPTLHVVATSHLDTQWRWTFEDTITCHIPRTLRENFALFERYPSYTFSFEGAVRYAMAREYFPEQYARLKEYIATGRWRVCGSAVDAGDVNVVSPESLVRQFLYGNGFFRREFGVESRDVFLPDCFGFGWALPSVAVHCGLLGFSTSKLEWGSAKGIPFDIGIWEGVDGSRLAVAINPGQYSFGIREEDLANDASWLERLERVRTQCGAAVGFKYFGLGDTGGAPDEESVRKLEAACAADGKLRVVSAGADQLFRDLTEEQKACLPVHADEFLLIEHGVGTYTSMAAMKRWNRRNECHATAAEAAAVMADWLGAAPYPREKLERAWTRVLANQMHDILPGTSIPQAYRLSWNDEVLSLNEFHAVLEHGMGSVASALDTQTDGVPVVVFNPLSFAREDVVDLWVPFVEEAPDAVRVFGPDGREVPSQILDADDEAVRVLFLARVPSVGFAVFEVHPAVRPCEVDTGLRIDASCLESPRYHVQIDGDGNIAAIHDRATGRALLDAPIRLQFLPHSPKEWPAWTIEYKDLCAEPTSHVEGPAQVSIVESGPVRVALEIRREECGSEFVQRVTLTAGGDRLDVAHEVVWNTYGAVLKAAFPLAVHNPRAVYDLGLGVIERGNNHERQHEVPAQQWAAVLDPAGAHGVAIATDCKYGWDKPTDNVLRLTLLHTPEPTGFHCFLGGAGWDDHFEEQRALDFGTHRFTWSVIGLGQRPLADAARSAARLNQPMLAAATRRHAGSLGRTFSLLDVSTDALLVTALKKAEESDEVVVRVRELEGRRQADARVRFNVAILAAREIDGSERPVGETPTEGNALRADFEPWRLRSFAVTLATPPARLAPPTSVPLELPFNLDGISANDNRLDGDFDGRGHSLPAELIPSELIVEGVAFRFGPTDFRARNVVVCRGQTIELPNGDFNRLYLLAASVAGDIVVEFVVDDEPQDCLVPDWEEPIGQWDSRLVNGVIVDNVEELEPGYVKTTPVAWVATHRHARASMADEAYRYGHFFKIALDLPAGARELRLPDDSRVRLLAATVALETRDFLELADPY